jgi:GNAT superfamily N-acetyltransferase
VSTPASHGFEVTTDLDRIDLDLVHRWLSTDAHWALGRTRETVERAAAHSMNFGLLDPDGRLRGYARIVTDHATFAWWCDVYLSPEMRGRGLGALLVAAVIDELGPLHIKRQVLVTSTAPWLYERLGFAGLEEPATWVILSDPATG